MIQILKADQEPPKVKEKLKALYIGFVAAQTHLLKLENTTDCLSTHHQETFLKKILHKPSTRILLRSLMDMAKKSFLNHLFLSLSNSKERGITLKTLTLKKTNMFLIKQCLLGIIGKRKTNSYPSTFC